MSLSYSFPSVSLNHFLSERAAKHRRAGCEDVLRPVFLAALASAMPDFRSILHGRISYVFTKLFVF